MYDFIKGEVTLSPSENFSTSEVNKIDVLSYGYQHYQLKSLNVMKIRYNDDLRILKFEGSIPYFWNGHNYHQTKREFIQAINFISTTIGVDIKKAIVKRFEYGKTIEVDHNPWTIIANHSKLGSKRPSIKDECKFFFPNGSDYLKMYNAKKNYRYKTTIKQRQSLMVAAGFDSNKSYIRIENHYQNLERIFGCVATIEDLISSPFINFCRRNLFQNYKRIKINTPIGYPCDKKHLNSLNICIIAMMNLITNQNLEENIHDLIWHTIENSSRLNKNDRDGRKRQFKKSFDTLFEMAKPHYDLSLSMIRKIAKDRY
ncbi:hypothetical protein FHW88_001499 [Mucilaginibacter sp. SG538B]|uniref:hypothetical protein n=1 Tax=Mucilaginibacter sp. SG538B TaxID=2587021 RepID=UPI00159D9DCE|nr:hypothetical protein [Mucilaginibacter sp. SG538B]NVM63223.1 hypothetical protein [Mucilaginibacter sp. SG538B]